MAFKIIIKKQNSKGKLEIIDAKYVDTRDEAETFIKACKALPMEYKIERKTPDCFFELSHR
jgi:hypothetical protein